MYVLSGVGAALRALGRFRARTQNQLNAAQAPQPRDYAAGYGEVLLATAVPSPFDRSIDPSIHPSIHRINQSANRSEHLELTGFYLTS